MRRTTPLVGFAFGFAVFAPGIGLILAIYLFGRREPQAKWVLLTSIISGVVWLAWITSTGGPA